MKTRLTLFAAAFAVMVAGCAGSDADDDCTGEGMQMCGDVCVNTLNDKLNCGGCSNSCGGDATCSAGVCGCSGSLEYCSGECVNTNTDNDHCGECLSPCTGDLQCRVGSCITPYDESCDGEDNDFDGVTDEGDDGQPLQRACDNLCGEGVETCTDGAYSGCTAPAASEEVCDEVDNDCDGLVDEDVTNTYYEDYDLDGQGDPDLAWSTEACSKPDGASPNGGVWVENNTDCNDVDDTVYDGADELCDDKDNDCDGDVDEGCSCSPVDGTRECGTDVGECVKGTQTCAVDGWGPCGGDGYVAPALGETCNHLDDDCDGEVDEELADDLYENNDTCAQARVLPAVWEDTGVQSTTGLTLYHGTGDTQDVDWFTVTATEADHLDCLWNFFKTQCNFRFLAVLNVPADDVHEDYVMCVHSGTCGDFDYTFCTDTAAAVYDADSASYQMLMTWDGTCGLDDSWNFYVEVKYQNEAPTSCDQYSVEFALLYDGPIADDADSCPRN